MFKTNMSQELEHVKVDILEEGINSYRALPTAEQVGLDKLVDQIQNLLDDNHEKLKLLQYNLNVLQSYEQNLIRQLEKD